MGVKSTVETVRVSKCLKPLEPIRRQPQSVTGKGSLFCKAFWTMDNNTKCEELWTTRPAKIQDICHASLLFHAVVPVIIGWCHYLENLPSHPGVPCDTHQPLMLPLLGTCWWQWQLLKLQEFQRTFRTSSSSSSFSGSAVSTAS